MIANKGDDPSKYTPEEQATAMLSWQIRTIEDAAENNTLLKVIPDPNKDGEWVSPWELVCVAAKDRPRQPPHSNNGPNSPTVGKPVRMKSGATRSKIWRIPTKCGWPPKFFYNKARPFHIALLAFLCRQLCVGASGSEPEQRPPFLDYQRHRCSSWRLWRAQGAGLACRIFLLSARRSAHFMNQFFVGAVAPLFALALEHKLKNGLGKAAVRLNRHFGRFTGHDHGG